MKTRSRRAGTALLLALLVVMASVFVLAGWATMLAARSVFSEQFLAGQKRRIAYENAKNIGKQWGNNAFNGAMVPTATVTLTNDWGQFTAATIISNPISVGNTASVAGLNAFGPMGTGGFVTNISTTLSGDGFTNSRQFLFRSRSPVLGGYPLVAHYNPAATNTPSFAGITVATNGRALMLTNAAALTNSPVAPVYQAATNRLVLSSFNTNAPAPISAYPFVPMSSGVNTFDGQLPANPARMFTLSNLRAAIDQAYGTNAPSLAALNIPNGADSSIRVLGNISTFPILTSANTSSSPLGDYQSLGNASAFRLCVMNAPTSPERRFLIVDQIPNSTLHYVNDSEYVLTLQNGTTYRIFLNNNWLRIRHSNNNKTLSNDSQYLRVLDTGGNASRIDSKGSSIVLTDAGNSRLIAFMLARDELVTLMPDPVLGSKVDFSSPTGTYASRPGGVALFNADAYLQSDGIAFLVMSRLLATSSYNAQDAISPQTSMQYRATVDGFPLVQISPPTQLISFSGSSTAFLPSSALPVQVLAGSTGANLLHIEQDAYPFDSSLRWNKALIVLNASASLDVEASASALTFSYLSPENLGIQLSDQDSTRPFALNVVGPGPATIGGGGGRNWNLTASFLGSSANFALSGDLTINGGIRSNSSVTLDPGGASLSLQPNANPGDLELFTDRMGWIESWQP